MGFIDYIPLIALTAGDRNPSTYDGLALKKCFDSATSENTNNKCSALLKIYKNTLDSFYPQHPNSFERMAWLYKIGRLRKAQEVSDTRAPIEQVPK